MGFAYGHPRAASPLQATPRNQNYLEALGHLVLVDLSICHCEMRSSQPSVTSSSHFESDELTSHLGTSVTSGHGAHPLAGSWHSNIHVLCSEKLCPTPTVPQKRAYFCQPMALLSYNLLLLFTEPQGLLGFGNWGMSLKAAY